MHLTLTYDNFFADIEPLWIVLESKGTTVGTRIDPDWSKTKVGFFGFPSGIRGFECSNGLQSLWEYQKWTLRKILSRYSAPEVAKTFFGRHLSQKSGLRTQIQPKPTQIRYISDIRNSIVNLVILDQSWDRGCSETTHFHENRFSTFFNTYEHMLDLNFQLHATSVGSEQNVGGWEQSWLFWNAVWQTQPQLGTWRKIPKHRQFQSAIFSKLSSFKKIGLILFLITIITLGI